MSVVNSCQTELTASSLVVDSYHQEDDVTNTERHHSPQMITANVGNVIVIRPSASSAHRLQHWFGLTLCATRRNNCPSPQFTWTRRTLTALLISCLAFMLFSLLYTGNQLGIGFQFSLMPWQGFGDVKQRLPQAIIVGVRKCGTRALLEFLSLHPDVCHAHGEMHFFNSESRYQLGLDWYRRQMPASRADQVTIEKTPGYFIARRAPDLIRGMNDSIKLLLIVRDPVTRIISDYTQVFTNRMKRNDSYAAFEDLVIDSRTGDVSSLYKPVWISLYYVHYMHWLAAFNRSQIHVVDGDALIQDPISELRKAESFLGLRHVLSRDNFYFNETRGFFCLRKGANSHCLHPSKGRTHPNIKPRVLHKLYRYFKPYNEKFFKISGQYFDWTEERRRKKRRSILRMI